MTTADAFNLGAARAGGPGDYTPALNPHRLRPALLAESAGWSPNPIRLGLPPASCGLPNLGVPDAITTRVPVRVWANAKLHGGGHREDETPRNKAGGIVNVGRLVTGETRFLARTARGVDESTPRLWNNAGTTSLHDLDGPASPPLRAACIGHYAGADRGPACGREVRSRGMRYRQDS